MQHSFLDVYAVHTYGRFNHDNETVGMVFGERKYFDERTWGHGLCTLRAGPLDRLRGNAACHEVDKSGFLGEDLYSKMTKGDEDKLEAALKWIDTNAVGRGQYKKIILDPIVLYRQPQHMGGGNSNENAQMLINYFYNKMYLAFSKHFEMVEQPSPGTMRFQIALTDYDQSWVALDMISTVVPQLRVVAELKGVATDKPTFVGGVQAEVKISDAETGKVLAAAIDRRVGGKTLSKGVDSWADVKNAMDFWALQADLPRLSSRWDRELW